MHRVTQIPAINGSHVFLMYEIQIKTKLEYTFAILHITLNSESVIAKNRSIIGLL